MKKVTNFMMPDNKSMEVVLSDIDLIDLCEYNIHIGDDVNIGHLCYFGKGITIKNSTRIGDYVRVGDNSIIEGVSVIGEGSSIGNRVKINKVVTIGRNVSAASDVFIDSMSVIGSYSIINKGVQVGLAVSIGKLCIITKDVPNRTIVPDYAIW